MVVLIQELFGYNTGLEKQEYEILELGDQFSEIDWSIIKQISNQLKALK